MIRPRWMPLNFILSLYYPALHFTPCYILVAAIPIDHSLVLSTRTDPEEVLQLNNDLHSF